MKLTEMRRFFSSQEDLGKPKEPKVINVIDRHSFGG